MADMLAEVSDLSELLDETITATQGARILKTATAAVQAAAGQRLIQATETVTLMGTPEVWFELPERPVTAVTSISLDGVVLVAGTDFKRFGSRLWRAKGWAAATDEPSQVAVNYTHGYAAGHQKLEFAKASTLVTAVSLLDNPNSATGMSVDDYREQFAQTADPASLVPKGLRESLRQAYARRAGAVRLG